jgi:predicted Zn-dependent protease
MSDNERVLELMGQGDTLACQRELLAADHQDAQQDDPVLETNRLLYGHADEAAQDFVENLRIEHLRALSRTPALEQGMLLYNLGCFRLFLDEVQDARLRFESVLEAEPDNRFARHNLAYTMELTTELDEAREQYRRVLQEDPGFTLSALNLALLDLQEGKLERGIGALGELHHRDPGNQGLLLYFARALLQRRQEGDPQEVVNLLDGLPAQGRPQRPLLELWECRAFALFLTGDLTEAEQAFRDLIGAAPDNLFARLGLIKVLAKRHDFPELLQQLEEYQALHPPGPVDEVLKLARSL